MCHFYFLEANYEISYFQNINFMRSGTLKFIAIGHDEEFQRLTEPPLGGWGQTRLVQRRIPKKFIAIGHDEKFQRPTEPPLGGWGQIRQRGLLYIGHDEEFQRPTEPPFRGLGANPANPTCTVPDSGEIHRHWT
jgi:hypothetical protein